MSFTEIDIQRFVGNAIKKASIDNKMEIKFDIDNFMKSVNINDERCDDVKEKVVVKEEIERINAQQEKKKLTKEERQANKAAKEAVKKAKEQAKAAKEAEKQAKEQAKADKLAAKEAEKQAKEQTKADKLAAKEAEKQAKEQAKADKLAAKEQSKAAKKASKEKGKRGRPKKDNLVEATGDYSENVEAQNVDLVQQLAESATSQPEITSLNVTDNTSNDDNEKFEDVQVHLFEFAGVMYYKSDDHQLYHHDTQDEIGSWDPVLNVIVYKEEE